MKIGLRAFALILCSTLAYSATLPQKDDLTAAFDHLEGEVYSSLIDFDGKLNDFKRQQLQYYYENLYNNYLAMAGQDVELEWVVQQIGDFFERQVSAVGLKNINRLSGSIARRLSGLDGHGYFPKLFAILLSEETDRKSAEELFNKALEIVCNKYKHTV